MSRHIIRIRADRPRKLKWLAAGWESPAHLCVVQDGVGATICGARPKQLHVMRASQTRCQDCDRIDQVMRAERRAVRVAKLKRFFSLGWLNPFRRFDVTLHRDGTRVITEGAR